MLRISTRRFMLFVLLTSLISLLGACASTNEEKDGSTGTNNTEETQDNMDEDHGNMDMSGSGEVPEGLKDAASPTYKVGSKAIIESDHMPGMKGAEATIAGAYDTTVYTVSYTPTTGGEKVEDHKWVIHEELEGVGEEALKPGSEVTINAEHMEGMDGVTAEIDSAEQTTVYMVDFTLTTNGEEVKNHKWVTEDELSPVE
ncbi:MULTISPECIES: YdhK family protein [Bacillota]|uniref:YdhK family protein n=1 Tax=Bacillota TaxID=1239 RepID=UPI0039EE1161